MALIDDAEIFLEGFSDMSKGMHRLNMLRMAIAVGNVTPVMEVRKGRTRYAWLGRMLFCPEHTSGNDDARIAVSLGLLPDMGTGTYTRARDMLKFVESQWKEGPTQLLGVTIDTLLLMADAEALGEVINSLEEKRHA